MGKTSNKTWAREIATALFIGCAILAYQGRPEELSIVIWPVTVFGLSAFGFKQPSVDSWMNNRKG